LRRPIVLSVAEKRKIDCISGKRQFLAVLNKKQKIVDNSLSISCDGNIEAEWDERVILVRTRERMDRAEREVAERQRQAMRQFELQLALWNSEEEKRVEMHALAQERRHWILRQANQSTQEEREDALLAAFGIEPIERL
jgi:L-fucose isomerase-like protein